MSKEQITVILTLSHCTEHRFEWFVTFDKPATIPKHYEDRQQLIAGMAIYHYIRTLPAHDKLSTVHGMDIRGPVDIFLGRQFIDAIKGELINRIVEKMPDAREAPSCELWLEWWSFRWSMTHLTPAVPAQPATSQPSSEDIALLQEIKKVHALQLKLTEKESERKTIQAECDAVGVKLSVNWNELTEIRGQIKEMSGKILETSHVIGTPSFYICAKIEDNCARGYHGRRK